MTCDLGHESHATRVVPVRLEGRRFHDFAGFPEGRQLAFDLEVFDYERYAVDAKGFCPGRDGFGAGLIEQQIWEAWETRLVVEILARGPDLARGPQVVVDVGSHVGWYSAIAVLLGHRVIAFEADAESARLTAANVLRAQVAMSTALPLNVQFKCPSCGAVAVTMQPVSDLPAPRAACPRCRLELVGRAVAKAIANCPQEGATANVPFVDVRCERVTAQTTLTSSPMPEITLLKADVEGDELEVVRAASDYISHGLVRNMLLEISPCFRPGYDRLLDDLMTLGGFRAYRVPDKSCPYIEEYSADPLAVIERTKITDPYAYVAGIRQENVLLVREDG